MLIKKYSYEEKISRGVQSIDLARQSKKKDVTDNI